MRGIKSSQSGQSKAHFELLETRQLLSGTLQVPSAQYPTIQSAVNAAHKGDNILVAPGTYTEQVVIPSSLTNLTIRAKGPNGAAIIQAPAVLTGQMAIVYDQANGFEISGFTIQGPSNGISAGVLVNGASNVEVDHSTIVHIHDNVLSAAQSGYGVKVYNGGSAQIDHDVIADYQKGGVSVQGSTSSASVSQDTVTGVGPTAATTQNGIEFVSGAQGSVDHTVVSANQSLAGGEAAGILGFNSGQLFINHNTVYNNDGDIILDGPCRNFDSPTDALNLTDYNDGSVISHNETYGATFDGISLFDHCNSATIDHNYSHNNGFTGILLTSDGLGSTNPNLFAVGNLITHNTFSNNGTLDLEDDSVYITPPITGDGGTGNFYDHNKFGTTNTTLVSQGADS